MRFCPGGLLEQAVESCKLFLDKGTILTTKGPGKDEKSWKAFERKFRAEMNKPDQARVLDLLTAFSRRTSFSIGCYCENEERCHRLILKKLLAERGVEFS